MSQTLCEQKFSVSAVGNGTWSRVESEVTYKTELCSKFKLVETANIELMWLLWHDINQIAAMKLIHKCTLLNYQIETYDRQMVDVDQQLLDKTGNSLGIEYSIRHKIFGNYNINFVNFATNIRI